MRWRFLPVVEQAQEESTLILEAKEYETRILIDPDTYINIFFDTSGSMNSTLAPLQQARDLYLRNALLPFFDNNEGVYDNNVTFINIGNERPIEWISMIYGPLTTSNFGNSNKIINLAFTDENSPYNQLQSVNSVLIQDINALSSNLAVIPNQAAYSDNYRSILFSVINSGVPSYQEGAYDLIKGEGVFETNSTALKISELVDEGKIGLMRLVPQGRSAQYYTDLIISAIEGLGYTTDP